MQFTPDINLTPVSSISVLYSYLKEYYDWVDKFEPLVQKYKAGEYEGEKLKMEIAELSI